MGNGESKPEQHIFNADAPVRFSQGVLDSLQNSKESDSTRAQDLELKIQARVNSELKRIRDAQAKQITDLTASLGADDSNEQGKQSDKAEHDPNSLAFHLSSPFYQDHSASKTDESASKGDADRTHDSVQKEIAELRRKLDARKKLDKIPAEVEKAREGVVKCLRDNDRRPLDCWREVDQFKTEVGKLEQAYMQRFGR